MKLNYCLTLDEIVDYNFPLDKPFYLEVNHENITYDLIVRLSSFDEGLICCGSNAHLRTEKTKNGEIKKPPFFDRWTWYKYFDESFIAYADPSFYYDDNITLGWFVGKETWYLEVIGKIIKNIAKNRKISNENILFFGSSGGGFASIGLATLLKGSKTIVNNSSFSIRDITKRHYDILLDILKNSFPDLSEEEILDKLKHRIDLIELFKYQNYVPDITYYANTYSKGDMQRGSEFINRLIDLQKDNKLDVHYYYHEDPETKGHVPMNFNNTLNALYSFNNPRLYESINENKKLKKQIKKLRKKVKKNKEQLKQIKNSKSWKLTEPLRKLKQLLKKIKKLLI